MKEAAALWNRRASQAPSEAPFDVEQMLARCLPGGHSCDPQAVADAIRAYCPQAPSEGADARDAARYRWLRDSSYPARGLPICSLGEKLNPLYDEDLDAAIDAAIAASAGAGEKDRG